MTIKVRFFASLAETVGRREAECPYVPGITLGQVWRELNGGQALPSGVLCAVDFDYREVDDALDDNVEVAFFPPVTGG